MVVNIMKWIISILLGIGMFAVSIIVALLLVNSFLTIAVAQSNRMIGATGADISTSSKGITVRSTNPDSDSVNINIEKTEDNGFIIHTKDGMMKLTESGIEMPAFGI
jgi:hypothetical protein